MLLCEKKRFVSSANIMGSNILDTLHKSRLDVFIAPAYINCFLFER